MIIQIKNNQKRIKSALIRSILHDTAICLEDNLEALKELADNNVAPVISVLLTNDKSIRQLNNDFRGIDKPTDVLSFPAIENNNRIIRKFNDDVLIKYPDGHLEAELGDIVISVQTVLSQAEEIGNTFEEELRFLFIHSVLHLLGYDHIDDTDEKSMSNKQKELVAIFDKEQTK